jgi:hypothetical protein
VYKGELLAARATMLSATTESRRAKFVFIIRNTSVDYRAFKDEHKGIEEIVLPKRDISLRETPVTSPFKLFAETPCRKGPMIQ